MHILTSGRIGGIETQCVDFGKMAKNHELCFVKNYGPLIDEAKVNDINFVVLFEDRKLNIFDVNYAYKKIEAYANENDIKCFVMHNGSIFIWLLTQKLKCNKKFKVILYAHCCYEDNVAGKNLLISWCKQKTYKDAIKKADYVFAISQTVRNSLLNNVQKKYWNKIIINYNGINFNRFKYVENRTFANLNKIVYVGRLVEQKGVQNILKILSLIENKNFIFTVIGDGVYKNELESLAKKLNLDNNVVFLGERTDVSELLNENSIFMHFPVYEEGFGITIIEALYTGLICITNKNGAMKELVDDTCGFSVQDELHASKVLEKILSANDFNSYYDIMRKAHERASNFNVKKTIKNIEEYFVKLFETEKGEKGK